MPDGTKAVIFDIDGTLMPGISWNKLTVDLGADFSVHDEAYNLYCNRSIAFEEAHGRVLRLWQGTGRATRDEFRKIFAAWPLREGAEDLFNYLHAKGYATCLITGSMDLFAQVTAERLGVRRWYADATLEWDAAGNLVDFFETEDEAERKKLQFQEYCRSLGITLAECVAVGDDRNDVELFKLTGRGIAVESPTSAVLDGLAWRQVKELSEIKSIL